MNLYCFAAGEHRGRKSPRERDADELGAVGAELPRVGGALALHPAFVWRSECMTDKHCVDEQRAYRRNQHAWLGSHVS